MQADGQSALPGTPAAFPQLSTLNPQPPQIPDHELLCLIGRGAYGEVWLARNAIGTLRAVKIVYRQSFQRAEQFEREFKGLLKFEPISRSHDGLVDVLQIGRRDEAGYFYYVMELADDGGGESEPVRKWERGTEAAAPAHFPTCPPAHLRPDTYAPRTLRSELQTRGRLPPAECVALGVKLTAALKHLHANGLLHRDIKPSNIIFVNGEPKLADIGLVTAIDEAHSLVGTVGYIPPEGPGTPQADLYSLGKVLYEIALGKDRQDFPQLPPDLSSHPDYAALLELNEVILKACETDPHRRYPSAAALGADLGRLQQGRSVKHLHATERRWSFMSKCGLAAAAVVLVLAGCWWLADQMAIGKVRRSASTSLSPAALDETKSIAVLPFDNESLDQAHGYLGTQLAEELSSKLARIPKLRVLGRDSAAALKRAEDLHAAAQQLKVNTLLTGTIRTAGDQLQLTAQLIRATDDSLLWSQVYDKATEDILGFQIDVAANVAGVLKLDLSDTVHASLARETTRNVEAYRSYLGGRDWLNLGKLAKALSAFQEASRLDTNFSLAYAGLSDVYGRATAIKQLRLSPQEALSNTLALADHAVKLNTRSAEGHCALARARTRVFDWDGAMMEFQLALKLNPNLAHAYQTYAHFLGNLGRFDEAIAAAQHAKTLDPWSVRISGELGWAFYHAHQYEAAQKEFAELIKLDPYYTSPSTSVIF